MPRIFSTVVCMLLALPAAAGEAWSPYCSGAVSQRCCCHEGDEDAGEASTLERRCCCAIKASHPGNPAATLAVEARPSWHPPAWGWVDPGVYLAPVLFEPVPTPSAHPTGPPTLLRINCVRLRP